MTIVLLCMVAWLLFAVGTLIGLSIDAANAPYEPPGENWG